MVNTDFRTSTAGGNKQIVFDPEQTVLVTGANGFIGASLVRRLLAYGIKRVRCLTRPTSRSTRLDAVVREMGDERVEIVKGNLLSPDACSKAVAGISIIYHLAAGVDKTYSGCFLNSVVTTRNLIEAALKEPTLRRFVSISSLAVYTNESIPRQGLLTEACQAETKLVERHEPYVFAKAKQDDLVVEYAKSKGLPFVLIRPGVVFGPGKAQISGRVGIDTFGLFLHLGLKNQIPFTYLDNCAEAIALAGFKDGIEGEVINIVDDDLPSSREFLRLYKRNVRRFVSLPVPFSVFSIFCRLWESYARWSEGQLPPVFNKRRCDAYWKGNEYSNEKAKSLLEWRPEVQMDEALRRYFAHCRTTGV